MLRVEASLRTKVFAELKALQSEITAAIAALPQEATQFKRARLNALLDQTTKSINATYDLIAQANGKSLSKIAGLEQAKTNQILNNTFQVEVATVAQTPKQLEAMVGKQLLDGKFHKEWWAAQADDLRDKFQRTIRTGVAKGEGIDALVRRVIGTKANNYTDGIMLLPRYQAAALVRTSVQSAANEARINSFLANLDIIKGIQWRSTLDSRTSKICVGLDGKQWSLPDFTPVGHDIEFPGPTAHWNCRSTQTAVTKGWDELSKKGGVKPPGRPAQPLDQLLTERLQQKGLSEKQIAAALEEKRLAFDGEAAAPVSFDEFLKGKSNEFQDQLLGKQRAQLWREGKIHLSDLIDQSSRPLTVDDLHGLIAKNQALSAKTYKEGENGLSLVDRKLLEESMVQGVQQKSELTHFLNLENGERITINGRSPSAADLAVIAKYPKLSVLRNSLGVDQQYFSPQEMLLFGQLPNFTQARIVSPAGRVLTLTVKKSGPGFNQEAASAINVKVADLSTQKAARDAFIAGVRSQGSLRVGSITDAGTVQPSTQVFNQTFGSLSLPRPLTKPIDEPAPGVPKSTFEVVKAATDLSPQGLAQALFENAQLAAPRHDAAMQALAAQSGGTNIGLEYSVKTQSSLLKKITEDVLGKGLTPSVAASRVGDSVRYTITFDPAHYAEGARQIMTDLEASGYDLIRWKNFWDDPLYHGINATVRDKQTGLFVELQLHTPASWDTKQNKTHAIYEAQKLAKQTGDQKAYQKAQADGAALWRNVPVPEGARYLVIADPPAKITTENIAQYRGGLNTFALAEKVDQAADAFKASPDAQWVDLSQLISPKDELSDRAFLAGMKDDPRANAMKGMLKAIDEGGKKRDPLDVRANSDGTFTVIDGNATSQAAMLAGWKQVPVIIHDAEGAILSKPVAGKFVAPEELKGLPTSIDGLVRVSSLGGTTGAELFRDPKTGLRYVVKHGASPEHVRSEGFANDLYRALGIPVPASRIIETPGGPIQLARFVENAKSLKDYMASATADQRAKVTKAIQNDFAADALLSNIDVLGTDMDNVLVDAKGKAWRIDNGGALAFRAQGAAKTNWNQGALELWSMRQDKWLPSGVTGLFANKQFFSPLTIENIAQQIMQLPKPNFSFLPTDLAEVLGKRFDNAKVIARAALEAQRDQFKLPYVDELSRGRMILRGEAMHEALPAALKAKDESATYNRPVLNDPTTNLMFDHLVNQTTLASGAPVVFKEEIYQKILAAVKSYNHSIDTGKPVNQAKIDAALASEGVLQTLVAAAKTVADRQSAQDYRDALTALRNSIDSKSKAKLPLFSPRYTQPESLAKKGGPSIPQRMTSIMLANGANPDAVVAWAGDHAGSTWEGYASAYKRFLAEQTNIPTSAQYWRGTAGKQTIEIARRTYPNGQYEATMTLWHSLVQEILETVDLPLVDRERRLVRVLRTEAQEVWEAEGKGKRGMNESGSLINPFALNNSHLTIQAVPFSRVTGLYFLGRPQPSGYEGQGLFAGVGENEISFIAAGQQFLSWKPPSRRESASSQWLAEDKKNPQWASDDASLWGIPLDWLQAAIVNESLRTP